jgi:hypothetical protein
MYSNTVGSQTSRWVSSIVFLILRVLTIQLPEHPRCGLILQVLIIPLMGIKHCILIQWVVKQPLGIKHCILILRVLYNTATGTSALRYNTTGSNNTSVGIYSSEKNTTGTGNVALGYTSLMYNTTGSYNIAVGHNAGRFIADGTTANTSTSNSVFLGYNTKALDINQTNQIVIGDAAVGLGSNTAILGNSSITKTQLQGNVGIGTASPQLLFRKEILLVIIL